VLASWPWFRLRASPAALALAALAGTAGHVQAQDSTFGRFIHRSHLDNGLDMIVVENHTVPLATARPSRTRR
jgi:hypothetical protein